MSSSTTYTIIILRQLDAWDNMAVRCDYTCKTTSVELGLIGKFRKPPSAADRRTDDDKIRIPNKIVIRVTKHRVPVLTAYPCTACDRFYACDSCYTVVQLNGKKKINIFSDTNN
uniref:Uncharacterized protein n=1 Tax=Sipha flava TaxID=143950 RepID=A0A2S2QW15_9HEMI